MRHAVDEMVLVSEDQLRNAVRLLHQELGLVVEPSGAASLAGVGHIASMVRGGLVAIILSGGNLAPALIPTWLS
jgi:threonine dehydratase